MARSFDRTAGSLDNARTYYFSNIVPQAADQNQGPWALMENYLGDFARVSNKEVYVIAGVAGSKGTIKDEGKITIPAYTWKVAVIMDRDKGLADVKSAADVMVEAVVMPNVAGIRNVDWRTYRVTVDSVEALSGYDLLALIEDQIEIAIESNTRPPVAVVNGPFVSTEGATIVMSAAQSSDPDGDALTYSWNFGNGTTGSGVSVSPTYVQDGLYTVTLTVTDVRGLTSTVTTTATVNNVAPSIAAFAGATLLPGETYSAAGSFTDPGADTWSATVNYGNGSGTIALPLSAKTFTLSRQYPAAGVYTVTVRVADDDVTSMRTATVTVLTPVQGLEQIAEQIAQLVAAGTVSAGNGNSLGAKLDNALKQLQGGKVTPARNMIEAFLNELDAMVPERLSAAHAAPLRTMANRVLASLAM